MLWGTRNACSLNYFCWNSCDLRSPLSDLMMRVLEFSFLDSDS